MKIRVWVSTNLVRSKVETIIEVDEEASEEDIEYEAREAMFNMMDWGWEPVNE